MLSSKVALVTGGAQGIGLATVKLFLKNGARVSLVDVSEDVGRVVCDQLQQEFGKENIVFLPCDVADSKELQNVFERTKKAFGKLDIVCNNAGIGNKEMWRKMLDINLAAVIEGTFLGLKHMSVKSGGQGGAIVNVASFAGIVPVPFNPCYCASKHGVVGFTRSMAMCAERDSVRVNCICPEFVETRMVTDHLEVLQHDETARQIIQSKGLIAPETVAEGILELATDTSNSGRAMTVTADEGNHFITLPGDPSCSDQRS